MSKTKAAPFSAGRLKSFISRIETLNEEVKAIQGDVKDVYAEAKGVGYDVGTMRKVIRLRAMDAADRAEQETLLDVYMHALEQPDRIDDRLAAGESQRDIAKAEGVSKSTVQRRGPKTDRTAAASEMDHPHDPDTGEVHDAPADRGRDTAGVPEGAPVGEVPVADEGRATHATQLRAQIPTSTDPGRLEREAAAIEQNAAPQTCVDDGSASAVADSPSVVPRPPTPQAVEVGPFAAAPVPDGGVGTGNSFQDGNSSISGGDACTESCGGDGGSERTREPLADADGGIGATHPVPRVPSDEPGPHDPHASDCAVHNEPAMPNGPCDCGALDLDQNEVQPASILPSKSAWHAVTAVREAHHARIEAAKEARRLERKRERDALAEANRRADNDDLTIPDFLRANRNEGVRA